VTQSNEPSSSRRPCCPLCEESFGDLQFRFLYERPVCVPCLNAFARRRIRAFVVDCLLLAGLALIGVLIGLLVDHPTLWRLLGLGAIPLLAMFLIKDGFDGQSPGKRLFDLQTIHAQTGAPVRFRHSVTRNQPFLVPPLILWMFAQLKSGPRMGDNIAGVKVIWKSHRDKPPFLPNTAR